MNDELAVLANDELRDLNSILECISIPDDILKDCLTSGFYLSLITDEGMQYPDAYKKSLSDFESLCKAAPSVSPKCLKMLSMAYTTILLFFEEQQEEQSIRSGAMMLISAATAKGAAIALLPPSVGYLSAKVQAERTEMLSRAGELGAEVRNKPYAAMKIWALEKASGMRGSQIDIARKLSGQLPEHLADISKDPMRLIYEALRSTNKSK